MYGQIPSIIVPLKYQGRYTSNQYRQGFKDGWRAFTVRSLEKTLVYMEGYHLGSEMRRRVQARRAHLRRLAVLPIK